MKYLPLMHNFAGKRCLVVGGGKIALRRSKSILDAGGIVDIIAQDCSTELANLIDRCGGTIQLKQYQVKDLSKKYALVVVATNDQGVNREISSQCKGKKILVNVADDASQCDVIFPITAHRDPIQIAISSGGTSPQFSRLLRDRINTLIPDGYGKLAALFGKYRNEVKRNIPDAAQRNTFWGRAVNGHIAESAFSGNMENAETQLIESIKDHQNTPNKTTGEVYLIGAGPGDPDLLTLRAFRLIQRAEVVLYDRLVSAAILERMDTDKELIYVGKKRAEHAVPQQDINQLLVTFAQKGKRVARLKGGDPFIFGRGGEEIQDLMKYRIPFQVIPGITAANGCACYAGIPLTHRDHAQSVRFVTGQLQNGTVNLDWKNLVWPNQTLVFYMGLQGLPIICEKLIEHGLDQTTPVALIEKGTTLEQRVYTGTLENLPATIQQHDVHAPTLTIVGSVVTLHSRLNWFNTSD